ncbi:MAG: hypothetical protein IJS01_13885 [Lentisphaeria bacterium]|nr:hypothetical protein [Lentisphaeria bacterium]
MRLNPLFQDGAVLQHGKTLPVWGETLPGTVVKGELAGSETFSRSSRTGAFTLYFPALPPGGPFELRVTAEGAPAGEEIVLRDILIGDVWLASGQSNMEYPLNASQVWWGGADPEGEPLARQQERKFLSLVPPEAEEFRFFTVERCASGAPEDRVRGVWRRMTPENAGDCSAAAAWFGLFLRQKIRIPVGLVVSSWGGTIAEAWTSLNGLAAEPVTKKTAQQVFDSRKKHDSCVVRENIDITRCAAVQPDPGNAGIEKGWAEPGFDDSSWKEMTIPGSWIAQDIAGNGAVWVRRSFDLPPGWAGEDLIFRTGGIDKHDIAYVNGVEVGRTGKNLECDHWNSERRYPVPGKLTASGKVTVAVRGFSFIYDGSFSGNWKLIRVSDGAEFPLVGVWKAAAEFDRGLVNIRKDSGTFGTGNPNTPGILFDGMIRPLLPCALRGVIWYQGESNSRNYWEYEAVLKRMIADWRFFFLAPDLPFFMVQLAGDRGAFGFQRYSDWAALREAQRRIAETTPGVFMASAVDRGEELNIHPQDKESVGYRLAQSALHHVYGDEKTVPSGPMILAAEKEGDSVRLTFRYSEGLTLKDGPQAFYLSADGKEFFPADSAVVENDTVLIRASAVPSPAEVRYAWADFPPTVLYNAAALPASPFKISVL